MAAATGSIAIASAGGSFDSATYPRFVLGDGTNSLEFVIDNDARGLKLSGGSDAAGYSGAGDLPFEDSQKTRLVVPTFDEADGAKKALLAMWITDDATFDDAWNGVAAASGGSITDISTRAHFVLRDAAGNEMKIGGGNADLTSLTNSSYTLIAKYGSSGSPRFWLYKKASTAEYFIRIVNTGTNGWKAHTVMMGAIQHANANSLIDISVKGIKSDGTLMTLSSVGNDTYTASESHGFVMEYDTAGFAGNACYMEFKDPNTDFNTSAKKRCMSWGYDEYSATNVYSISRHTLSPTDDQWWGENVDSKIWFRQGTIAGSGSDASLSTDNIAEALKEMINASILGITATRSGSTVSLTNDTDGDSGNVTITTTNAGSLFTVAGMSNTSSGGDSGGDTMAQKRMTISAKQMELKSQGGLSGSLDDKAALILDLDGLAGLDAIAQSDVFAVHDASGDAPKKISFSDLEDAVFANISGDASVAAGGDLTISALAVENSMLSGGIENSKLVNDSVTVVAGDALTGGGEVDLGASITLNVAVDDSSIEVSGDALQVKAAGITNDMLAGSIASSKIAELNSFDTDDLAEGASNQYFTQARARGSISVTDAGGDGSMSYDSSTGVLTYTGPSASEVRAHFSAGNMLDVSAGEFSVNASDFSGSWDAALATKDTDDLAEGSNLYFTDARARGAISVTDAGGDGSMSYDSSTGVITYTGPSASEVRAHFSGGVGVDISSGVVSIGQPVATSDNVQFADLVLTGDLTVGGTTTTVNSTEVEIADKAIVLGAGSNDSQVAAASGAGLKIGDESSPLATFLYDGVDSWDLSDHLNLASGMQLNIADANMLDADGAAKVRAAVAGDGLGHSAGVLSVNVDDSSIELDADVLQVKALGITNAMLSGAIASSKLAELNNFDTDDLAEGASNQYFTQARARGSISVTDAGGDGSLAYDSSTGVITYTGPSAAEVRAHLSAGNMLDFASGEFSVNASDFSGSWDAALATKDTDDLAEGSNLYYTDARARGAISVTDAGGDGSLSYDSSTGVITFTGPSAAEVRAHISVTDNGGDGSLSYDSGSGVISYTGPSAAEVRAHMSAGNMIDFSAGEIAVNAAAFSGSWDAALATKDTDDLAEGDNLYFTDARARAAVSVTDAGGDGSLSYNSSTGVITYTGPSAAEVRAHMSGAAGIDFSAGAISVNVDDSSIEISSDALQVKAQGIATSMLADDSVTAAKLNDDVKGNGIQISAGVLSISHAQEVFASTDLSSDVATLSGTPASDEAVFVFMNGLLLAEGASRDYTISGQAITLASENSMQADDELVVKYIAQ